MIEPQAAIWEGGSGKQYKYWVYPLPHHFPSQLGNYIFAKTEGTQCLAVYIGEGDLEDRVSNHHRADCIRSKGATHIHARKNEDDRARKAEESDLLDGNPEAYEPTGCNVKPGG
ncbi:hypothetical protein ES703_15359 [subsurface metagenome]|nr:hypothetical protein [Dehalococcoidia bacterium]